MCVCVYVCVCTCVEKENKKNRQQKKKVKTKQSNKQVLGLHAIEAMDIDRHSASQVSQAILFIIIIFSVQKRLQTSTSTLPVSGSIRL